VLNEGVKAGTTVKVAELIPLATPPEETAIAWIVSVTVMVIGAV
jgi:hypothetical protein